jgi:hypothetical protein
MRRFSNAQNVQIRAALALTDTGPMAVQNGGSRSR